MRIAPSQSSGVGRSPAERRHGAGSRAASHQARPPAVTSWREPHPLGVCGLPTPGAQRGAHVPRACPALAGMSAHCARRAGRCRPQPPEVHMTSADMPGTCWRLRDLDMSRTLRWHVHSRRWLLFGTRLSARWAHRAGRRRPQPAGVHMTGPDMSRIFWSMRDVDTRVTQRGHILLLCPH